MKPSDKVRVKRLPKRGIYDKAHIYALLDKESNCHIAFIHEGIPVIISTLYGRKDNTIYLHGSAASRMINELEKGIDLCFCVSMVQGIVLARSAFHHSINYESVVLFGKGRLVEDPTEKLEALKIVSDQVIPGRWDEVRQPNEKELKATKVISFPIDEASAKVRSGGPGDEEEDYALDIWAGVLPISKTYGAPENDPKLKPGIPVSESVRKMSGMNN